MSEFLSQDFYSGLPEAQPWYTMQGLTSPYGVYGLNRAGLLAQQNLPVNASGMLNIGVGIDGQAIQNQVNQNLDGLTTEDVYGVVNPYVSSGDTYFNDQGVEMSNEDLLTQLGYMDSIARLDPAEEMDRLEGPDEVPQERVEPGSYNYYVDENGNPVFQRDIEGAVFTSDGTIRDAEGNIYTYPEGGAGIAVVNEDGSINYYVDRGEGGERELYAVLNPDGTMQTGRVETENPEAYDPSVIVNPNAPDAPTYGTGYTPRSEEYRGTIYGDPDNPNNPGMRQDVYFDGENIFVYIPATGVTVTFDPEEAPQEVKDAVAGGGGGDSTSQDVVEESPEETQTSSDQEESAESSESESATGEQEQNAEMSSDGYEDITSGEIDIQPSEGVVPIDAGSTTVDDSDSEFRDTVSTIPTIGNEEYTDIISEQPGTIPSQTGDSESSGSSGAGQATETVEDPTDASSSIPSQTTTTPTSTTSGQDSTVSSETQESPEQSTVSDTSSGAGVIAGAITTGGLLGGSGVGESGDTGSGTQGSGNGSGGSGSGTGGGLLSQNKFKFTPYTASVRGITPQMLNIIGGQPQRQSIMGMFREYLT